MLLQLDWRWKNSVGGEEVLAILPLAEQKRRFEMTPNRGAKDVQPYS